jgi:hypothetical protein
MTGVSRPELHDYVAHVTERVRYILPELVPARRSDDPYPHLRHLL